MWPRRWWRGRPAVLAAAVLILLMAAPAAVLAAHASHIPRPAPSGPRTSQQISVSAASVRTVYLQSVPGTVSTQVTSGSAQVGVPQTAHSSHQVSAQLVSSNLQLQPS